MEENLLKRTLKSMTNIRPDLDKIEQIEVIRDHYKNTAIMLIETCNDTRELRLAIQGLENSLMWAIKNIVLN